MRSRTGTGFVALVVGSALWTVWSPAVAAQSPLDDAFAVLAEGNVEEGRIALLEAAADLAPSQSVGLIRLVRMLDRLGEAHGERGARAAGWGIFFPFAVGIIFRLIILDIDWHNITLGLMLSIPSKFLS